MLELSRNASPRSQNFQFNRPMTVGAQFNKLLSRVTPSLYDLQTYGRHEETVKRRLSTVFQANNVVRIGSYSRGSSIRLFSDIDLMLVLERQEVRPRQQWKTSTSVLNRVRNELLFRYPRTTVVRDGEAVVVRFGANQHPIEIVPAFYWEHGGAKNYPIFGIPDGDGWWTRTSPQAHNKFINDANLRSGAKLKKVARLIRYWRQGWQVPVPLSGFYVETLLARDGICNGAKSYAQCVNDLLATLANNECASLIDPMGVTEYIDVANTEEKRRRTQVAVSTSAKRAYRALIAEFRGDIDEATRLWDLVFNGRFPRR